MALPYSSAHQSLARLTGKWIGTGEVLPNPWTPSGPTTGCWVFRLDRKGYSLLSDFREEGTNGYLFEAHSIMTVDPATDEIVWFWFDSHGYPPLSPMRGRWDGRQLVLEKTTPRGVGRHRIDLDGNTFRITVEFRINSETEFGTVMQGTYSRDESEEASVCTTWDQ